MVISSPTLEMEPAAPGAAWTATRVVAVYCLAGRNAAAPPATTHRTNAARATARFRLTSLIIWRISMVSDHLVLAHCLIGTHGGGAAPS